MMSLISSHIRLSSHHLLGWWSKHCERLPLVSHSTCRPGTSQSTVERPDIHLLSRASLWRIVRRPFSGGTLVYLVYSYSKGRRIPHFASLTFFVIYTSGLQFPGTHNWFFFFFFSPAVAWFCRHMCVDNWELEFSIDKVKLVRCWCVGMS